MMSRDPEQKQSERRPKRETNDDELLKLLKMYELEYFRQTYGQLRWAGNCNSLEHSLLRAGFEHFEITDEVRHEIRGLQIQHEIDDRINLATYMGNLTMTRRCPNVESNRDLILYVLVGETNNRRFFMAQGIIDYEPDEELTWQEKILESWVLDCKFNPDIRDSIHGTYSRDIVKTLDTLASVFTARRKHFFRGYILRDLLGRHLTQQLGLRPYTTRYDREALSYLYHVQIYLEADHEKRRAGM